MGFFKTAFFIIVPTLAYSTWITIHLGRRLPLVCREFGNKIGLFYRYFKVAIRSSKPNIESGEIIHFLKKSDFQSMTFARETTKQFLEIKSEIKKNVPAEIQFDPFEKFRPKSDESIQSNGTIIDGTSILMNIKQESNRIKQKNKTKLQDNKFFEDLN